MAPPPAEESERRFGICARDVAVLRLIGSAWNLSSGRRGCSVVLFRSCVQSMNLRELIRLAVEQNKGVCCRRRRRRGAAASGCHF